MLKPSEAGLILASTSPYRRRLLERLQIPFACVAPRSDETPLSGELPQALARRLADTKALAVSALHPDALVLGSDQVAALDGQAMNKPGSIEVAKEQLQRSSGRVVTFYTAVSIAKGARVSEQRCVQTIVRFRDLSNTQISDYVHRETPLALSLIHISEPTRPH